ncbi:hypothetical protein ZWY2020_022188 [Hordeum vulgare]|nr:hypothetical protein ZWY2020_022188 [Hordeum vulgare]
MAREEDGGNGLDFHGLLDVDIGSPCRILHPATLRPQATEIQSSRGSASDSSMGDVGDAPLSIQLVANAGGDALTLSTTDSELSTGKDDPQTAGWAKRVRVGRAPVERLPCAGRVCALEKTLRCYAEKKTDTVVVPAIGYTFDSLGEAYDFYNLYSWEIGFGIRYGKSRLIVERSKCIQEIVCGCSFKKKTSTNSDYGACNTHSHPLWDASPKCNPLSDSFGMDLLVSVATGDSNPKVNKFVPPRDATTHSSTSLDVAPPTLAGPINWNFLSAAPNYALPMNLHDAGTPQFARISIDEPDPTDVYTTYDKLQKWRSHELRRKCVSHPNPFFLEMNGHAIIKNFGPGRGLKSDGMTAALRVFDIKDSKLYLGGAPRFRTIIGPAFADAAIYTRKEDGLQGVYSMFNKDTLEYSLEQSKKIMVILDVAKAWCVYEIDITSRSLLVMDPTLTSSPPGSLEDKHISISKQILRCLFKYLRACYPEWRFPSSPWTYKYSYNLHDNCSITESGFYVLHYVKEYDGTMLRISPTTGLITYMKMQMAHEILHMPGNKAHLEEKMYGRIQD